MVKQVQSSALGLLWKELKESLTSDRAVGNEWIDGNRDLSGILIYRKFSNLPLELVSPLHKSLIDDLQWAKSVGSDISADDKAFYSAMTHVVLFALLSSSEGLGKERSIDITGNSSILFDYFEDEIYHQRSSFSVIFKSACVGKSLAALVVPVACLNLCLADIDKLLVSS